MEKKQLIEAIQRVVKQLNLEYDSACYAGDEPSTPDVTYAFGLLIRELES